MCHALCVLPSAVTTGIISPLYSEVFVGGANLGKRMCVSWWWGLWKDRSWSGLLRFQAHSPPAEFPVLFAYESYPSLLLSSPLSEQMLGMAMGRMLPGVASVRERKTKEGIGRHLLLCLAWLASGSGLGAISRWFSSTSFPRRPGILLWNMVCVVCDRSCP